MKLINFRRKGKEILPFEQADKNSIPSLSQPRKKLEAPPLRPHRLRAAKAK